MTDRILRPRDVCRVIGLSRTTLWRWQRAGDFPRPVRLGRNSIGWRASTVQEWIDARSSDSA